jgi:hypothetical protein
LVEGVIWNGNGQSLVSGIHGWALGNCPRLQNAVHLQTKVIMKMRGVVLVNDEFGTHRSLLH